MTNLTPDVIANCSRSDREIDVKNTDHFQLKIILDALTIQSYPFLEQDYSSIVLPNDLVKLVQTFGLADYFKAEQLKVHIYKKIIENPLFIQYTNVRRYIILLIGSTTAGLTELILNKVSPDIMVFLLTDPNLVTQFSDLRNYKDLFKKHYRQFTIDRINQIENLKESQGVYNIYEEDLQLLPKQYYPVYKDEKDKQNFAEQIAQ